MSGGLAMWFRRCFSDPRLAPYLDAAAGDSGVASNLYGRNVEVSGAFYGLLHFLEITVRNLIHDQMRRHYARDDWWKSAPLSSNGKHLVQKAHDKRSSRCARSPRPDDVVANLSFGLWVSLASTGDAYDRTLRVPTLHRVFPQCSGCRKMLHDELFAMVLFRNRRYVHATGLIRLRTTTQVDSTYLAYYLAGAEVRDWITQHAAGTALPTIHTRTLVRHERDLLNRADDPRRAPSSLATRADESAHRRADLGHVAAASRGSGSQMTQDRRQTERLGGPGQQS